MALGRRAAAPALVSLLLGGCFLDYDKLSSVLDGGAGVAHCNDGVLDGDERDVDCGGSCGLCGADSTCTRDEDCSTGSCVSGHCERVSGPPFWLSVAKLPTKRTWLAAATGSDGLIYALGGAPLTAYALATVEAYSPETDQWIARAPMPVARQFFGAVTASDGRLYVLGDRVGTNAVDAYSPGTNSWAAATPMPGAVSNASAAIGADGGLWGFFTGADAISGEVLVYRLPPVDRWDSVLGLAPAQDVSTPHAAAGLDGRIYLLGEAGALLSIAPGERTWRSEDLPRTTRQQVGFATGADGLVYVIGGLVQGVTNSRHVVAYNPVTRRSLERAPVATDRAGMAATRGPDGRIYVIGGWMPPVGSGALLDIVEAYGPLIALSSSTAQPGSTLTMTGQNFAANATVTVTIGSTAVATGTTDTDGTLVAPLSFPAPTQSGSYRVLAVDNRSVYPVSAPLKVQ